MDPLIDKNSKRRRFLKAFLTFPILTSSFLSGPMPVKGQEKKMVANKKHALKISLNAYSFNAPLTNGSMTLDDMLEFCAEKGFSAVDITAYYFPGYPQVPADDYLYKVKRTAFSLGLEISGTGVRNDFTEPDVTKRRNSVALVKNWIDAAEKIGAPVIRIFSGNQKPAGFSREQILEWMLKDIRECIDYGKAHGVVVAIQNHDDFIKTADDTIQIMKAIDSEWFGLILDIGSFRTADPYDEIARTIGYAVNWQIKEKVYIKGKEVDVDLDKLIGIIKASGYKGYLPLETLGDGDPKTKISSFLDKFNRSLAKV
jgi:sugar phosphate isomerase/epimerase